MTVLTMMDNETYYYYTTPPNECSQPLNDTKLGYCAPFWDQIICWPETPANTQAQGPCPNNPERSAFRFCPPNGSWIGSKTDYSSCLVVFQLPDAEEIRMAIIIRDITFSLSIISLVLLLITIIIFHYFRSLACSRITIHKHLVVSFILRFVVNIIVVEPYIANRPRSYRDIDSLCKTVRALTQYTILSNTFWMFVEGFFLHHSLVLGVFSTEPPFKLFYSIGWGLPALIVLAWALVLHFLHDTPCWADHSQTNYHYIITIPFVLALVINLVFLVNIIRVLVSKLRANNRVESNNIRKAIKATVVLMPLLGLTNFIFFMNPSENKSLQTAYRVTNAVLSSSQGIFVAFLYCFMNGEVQRVLKQKWYRFKIRQVLHTPGRRQSSRTSSFYLSTGTELVQNDETHDEENMSQNAGEQLRLLQANLALQNEKLGIKSEGPSDTRITANGLKVGNENSSAKKNNNNGEVQFELPSVKEEKEDATPASLLLERETVI